MRLTIIPSKRPSTTPHSERGVPLGTMGYFSVSTRNEGGVLFGYQHSACSEMLLRMIQRPVVAEWSRATTKQLPPMAARKISESGGTRKTIMQDDVPRSRQHHLRARRHALAMPKGNILRSGITAPLALEQTRHGLEEKARLNPHAFRLSPHQSAIC